MTNNNNSFKIKIKDFFRNIPYDFVKITGILPAALLVHPTVYHVGSVKYNKIKGGVLISSNHVSFVDPIILLCALWKKRVFSLITKDVYKNRLMTFFLNAIQCIKVDKNNFSMKSFRTIVDMLKAGKSVLIFPEGKVNLNGSSPMNYKSGEILMAHNSKAKILPVFIVKGKKWYNKNIVIVGETIDIRAICGDFPDMNALKNASEYVRDREIELEEYYYKHILKDKNEEV